MTKLVRDRISGLIKPLDRYFFLEALLTTKTIKRSTTKITVNVIARLLLDSVYPTPNR